MIKYYKLYYSINGEHIPWFHNVTKGYWFWQTFRPEELLEPILEEYGSGYNVEIVRIKRLRFWDGFMG